MTRTEKIIYDVILTVDYQRGRITRPFMAEELMSIIAQAAYEINAKIPIYRPEELAEKLKNEKYLITAEGKDIPVYKPGELKEKL